jgi:WD40 repeat protein
VTAVRVRDRATGRQLHEFTVDGRFWDGSVAISPDGTTLAGSGGFNRLRLWDVATGKQRELTCQGVEDYTENVAFSPDSRLLASAGGKRIRLWDVATGERVGDLDSQGPVRSLAYSPDGKLLAATCGGHIRLLHAPTGKEAATLGGPEPKYWSVAFAPDGKTLLSGATNGEAALWDVATGKEVREFPGKDSMRVWSVAFAPDGRTVAVGHEGSMVRVWETATGKEVVAPEGHVNWPGFLSFTRDGKEVLTAAWDRTVRFWDPATGRETRRLKTDDAYWMEGALAPDGRTAAATGDKAVPLIDLATGKEVRRFPGHRYYSRNLVFTPDGKELITTGHMESDVRFWDAGTGKLLRRLRTPHVNQPWSLAISPDGRTMATGGEFDDALCLWDVAGGRKLREWHGHGKGQDPRERGIGVLAFSPDGKLLASSGPDDTIRLWEVPTARPQGVLHGAGQVAFSPDGRTLAASADGNAIRLWEVATGLERHRFVGHRGFVVRLAFSPDGRAMASASLDTTVLVWDVRGGGRHATLSPRELDAAWDRLAGADAAAAYDAVCALAAAPGSAVAFLRERIKPDAAPAPATLARLVKDLDSDRFEDRQKAAQELERLEELARPALREALAGKPSPELHRRVEQLLDRLDGLAPPPRRLRRLRAIEALEMIGNAASREVLRGVAAGDPDSRVQQEAKNALAR